MQALLLQIEKLDLSSNISTTWALRTLWLVYAWAVRATDIFDGFTFERAEIVNKLAADRVAEWQSLETLPDDHSVSLMDIGMRILLRHDESQIRAPLVITNTEDLVKQVQELRDEEEKLEAYYAAANNIMEADDEAISSTDNEGTAGNGNESEGSCILVENEEWTTSGNERKVTNPMDTSKVPTELSASDETEGLPNPDATPL